MNPFFYDFLNIFFKISLSLSMVLQVSSCANTNNTIKDNKSTLNKKENSEKKSNLDINKSDIKTDNSVENKKELKTTKLSEEEKKIANLSNKITTDLNFDDLSDIEKAIYNGDFKTFLSLVNEKNKKSDLVLDEKNKESSKLKKDFNISPIFSILIPINIDLKDINDFMSFEDENSDNSNESNDEDYHQNYNLLNHLSNYSISQENLLSNEEYLSYLLKIREDVMQKYKNRLNFLDELKKTAFFNDLSSDDLELFALLSYEIGAWDIFMWSIENFKFSKVFFENHTSIIIEALKEGNIKYLNFLKKEGVDFLNEKIYGMTPLIYWINNLSKNYFTTELEQLNSSIEEVILTISDMKKEINYIKNDTHYEHVLSHFDRKIDDIQRKIDSIDQKISEGNLTEKQEDNLYKEIDKLDQKIYKIEDERELELSKISETTSFYDYEDNEVFLNQNWKETLIFLLKEGENPLKIDIYGKNFYDYADGMGYFFISCEVRDFIYSFKENKR